MIIFAFADWGVVIATTEGAYPVRVAIIRCMEHFPTAFALRDIRILSRGFDLDGYGIQPRGTAGFDGFYS